MASNNDPNYNDDELIRLLELQRREYQRFYEGGETFDLDDIDGQEHRHRGLKRPPVPDMRFEPQFNNTIAALQKSGASPTKIFVHGVIINQIIMPFINGFSWCLASHLWQWWRVRSKLPRPASSSSSSSSFLRGIKYGIAKWFRNAYATFVHLPALTTEPAAVYQQHSY
ncbi:hypothetical protein K492DRAFT_171208 [Lichtheimia hyalospora FSU 10163]|nr:hypothetical protein K492DRAFT_171208 [Lichtheimia hyalospora FSU 10163]